MSIQSQINRIKGNVQQTLQIIKAEGVEAGTTSDDLPAAVTALSSMDIDGGNFTDTATASDIDGGTF